MKSPAACPKCGGEMKAGYILDHRLPSRWFEGKPETTPLGNIRAKGREQRHIESYRCVQCGYLELYAAALIK